jgi:hypothetical protein
VDAVKKLRAESLSGPSTGANDPIADVNSNAKKIGLFLLGAAYQKFGDKIEEHQEVVASITDVLMNIYAMESAELRARKCGREHAMNMAAVLASEAMDEIEISARTVLAACSEGDELRTSLAILRRFTKRDAVDTISLRRKIAARVLEAGRYVV